ncbi:Uncharacterized protein HZ326_29426 [Fusarium oxysporum f. sp. albedinis]|nr:Uncharacterized protein HZ326_29426 [Fusarium oxysporum f. sp. albedinis]
MLQLHIPRSSMPIGPQSSYPTQCQADKGVSTATNEHNILRRLQRLEAILSSHGKELPTASDLSVASPVAASIDALDCYQHLSQELQNLTQDALFINRSCFVVGGVCFPLVEQVLGSHVQAGIL